MSNRSLPALWILAMELVALSLAAAACGGKTTAVPPPSATPGVEYVSQAEIVPGYAGTPPNSATPRTLRGQRYLRILYNGG